MQLGVGVLYAQTLQPNWHGTQLLFVARTKFYGQILRHCPYIRTRGDRQLRQLLLDPPLQVKQFESQLLHCPVAYILY